MGQQLSPQQQFMYAPSLMNSQFETSALPLLSASPYAPAYMPPFILPMRIPETISKQTSAKPGEFHSAKPELLSSNNLPRLESFAQEKFQSHSWPHPSFEPAHAISG
jgi:hypothetical protein